jgi:endonuclease-3
MSGPEPLQDEKRVRRITERLWDEYGEGSDHERTRLRRDPLDSLIKTILSQNTSDVNSDRAFESLKKSFPTWEEALEAPEEALADSIRAGGLANIKAPRIQSLLRSIEAAHGALHLEKLHDMPPDEARDYLEGFKGVGRKTAACVLLFALQRPVFPVDTHCLRIGRRLRLIPEHSTADSAHEAFDAIVPDECKLKLHVTMVRHGRARCRPSDPDCEGCTVRRLCAYPEID